MKALYIDNIIKRKTNPLFTQVLLEKGYTVEIAANLFSLDERMKSESIKYHHIDLRRNPFHIQNIIAYKQMLHIIKTEGYDLIHCNSPIGGILGRVCGKKARVSKIIYTAHGFHFYRGAPLINRTLFKWAENWLARYTDALMTINTEDYDAAQGFKLRKNGKVYYLPGVGIDTVNISNASAKRGNLLKEINADEHASIIISIGELNDNKNNKIIIEALSNLGRSDLHYILCGIGEKETELRKLSQELGLQDNVHFFGYRNDIPELLKSSDIFVLPSYREGLSRSLMEAMSAGLPCIVSRIRGNVDLIEDGEGGFLHTPTDLVSVTKYIKTIIENDELRYRMGEYNKDISFKYDVENVKFRIHDIYSEILVQGG